MAVETYFQNERWPRIAALAVGGATVLSIGLMLTTTLPPPGYAVDPVTGVPTAELFPGTLRLLTPFLNVTGGLSLAARAPSSRPTSSCPSGASSTTRSTRTRRATSSSSTC